jgi:quercetin dioxygenase-like cupin family protein
VRGITPRAGQEEEAAMQARWVPAFAFGVLVLGIGTAAWAEQAPAVKRTVMEKHDLKGSQEGVMALVEIPPGGREGRHIHPAADVFGYVMEGTMTLDVEGRSSTTLKAGDHFFIEAGKVHEGINTSSVPVKLVGVFVAEKGKPLTTQVQ